MTLSEQAMQALRASDCERSLVVREGLKSRGLQDLHPQLMRYYNWEDAVNHTLHYFSYNKVMRHLMCMHDRGESFMTGREAPVDGRIEAPKHNTWYAWAKLSYVFRKYRVRDDDYSRPKNNWMLMIKRLINQHYPGIPLRDIIKLKQCTGNPFTAE